MKAQVFLLFAILYWIPASGRVMYMFNRYYGGSHKLIFPQRASRSLQLCAHMCYKERSCTHFTWGQMYCLWGTCRLVVTDIMSQMTCSMFNNEVPYHNDITNNDQSYPHHIGFIRERTRLTASEIQRLRGRYQTGSSES